jgi:hypothetical protein
MTPAQISVQSEVASIPHMSITDVVGFGVILVTRSSDNSSAEVVRVLDDGTRGWMSVRVDAGADGRFSRAPSVSTSGTSLSPIDAIDYAALITYAVTAILPTLTVEAR